MLILSELAILIFANKNDFAYTFTQNASLLVKYMLEGNGFSGKCIFFVYLGYLILF